MKAINADTLRDWQRQGREFILVDTLPTRTFAEGHLPGAINLVSDNVLDEAPAALPDKDATIVVYCASDRCKRAGRAAERLVSVGYTDIHHFVGGKEAWVDRGGELEA